MNDPAAEYSAAVRRYFSAPRHAGRLEGAREGRAALPDGTVSVVLYLTADGDTVREMRFLAFGCPYVIAACEWLCVWAENRDFAALAGFDPRGAAAALDAPRERLGRLLVVEDALRSLIIGG